MNIKFRIAKVDIAEFNFSPRLYLKGDNFGMKHTFSFSFDAKEESLVCSYGVMMEQMDGVFLSSKIKVAYRLSTDSIESLSSKNKVRFPSSFLVQCASIGYGTMRGVVCAKTLEQGFTDIIMPPMFISDIIKESFEAKLD